VTWWGRHHAGQPRVRPQRHRHCTGEASHTSHGAEEYVTRHTSQRHTSHLTPLSPPPSHPPTLCARMRSAPDGITCITQTQNPKPQTPNPKPQTVTRHRGTDATSCSSDDTHGFQVWGLGFGGWGSGVGGWGLGFGIWGLGIRFLLKRFSVRSARLQPRD